MGIEIRKVRETELQALLKFINSFYIRKPTVADNNRGFITHKYTVEDVEKVINYPFSLIALEKGQIAGCMFSLYKQDFLREVPEYFDDFYPTLHKDLPLYLQKSWSPMPVEEVKKRDFIFTQLTCVPKNKMYVVPLMYEYFSYMPNNDNILCGGHINYCSGYNNQVYNDASLRLHTLKYNMNPCLSRFRKETNMYNLFLLGPITNLRKGILRRYNVKIDANEIGNLAG